MIASLPSTRLDPADDLRVGPDYLGQFGDAVDHRIHASKVIAGDDGDDIGGAEQRVGTNDARQASEGLTCPAWAGVGRGDEHVRLDGHRNSFGLNLAVIPGGRVAAQWW